MNVSKKRVRILLKNNDTKLLVKKIKIHLFTNKNFMIGLVLFVLLSLSCVSCTSTNKLKNINDTISINDINNQNSENDSNDEIPKEITASEESKVQSPDDSDKTTNVEVSNLDKVVSAAVLKNYQDEYYFSDFATEAHTILKVVEEGDFITAYAMALYLEFKLEGDSLSVSRGSHSPTAITFEKLKNGEYEVTEFWTPKDGSYFSITIKEKFPEEIHDAVFDMVGGYIKHDQSCYEQAIQQEGVNGDAIITSLLNTIASSQEISSRPDEYIIKDQIEYRDLLFYGNYTLSYCFKLFEQGEQKGLKGDIMALICQDIMGIKGEALLSEVEYNNGQEWYDDLKRSALSLKQQYGMDQMEQMYPSSWLLLKLIESTKSKENIIN